MKFVYVAGPFRGPDHWAIAQNVRRATAVALEVWKAGAVPHCPHAETAHFQDVLPDRVWLDGDMEALSRCDAVVVLPDWFDSEGTKEELVAADRLGIPIFYARCDLTLPPTLLHWIRES